MSGLLRSDLDAFNANLVLTARSGGERTVKAVLRGAASPGLHAIILYRAAAALHRRGHAGFAAMLTVMNVALTGADIDPRAEIGPGLEIYHPTAIVIHGDTRIGARATLFSAVVFGLRGPLESGAPVAGDDLRVGAGAKILGNVKLGDRVFIGANAVVINDVPDDHQAVGVPARNLPPRSDSGEP